jgi:phosphoglycolate phosphatase
MEHESLVGSVKEKGIFNYFEEISGIHDHFAKSKIDMSKNFMQKFELDKDRCCLIGDSIHDYEVANELGITCLLVANGHQSYDRLSTIGCQVVTGLKETLQHFKINHFDIIYDAHEESK